jgi:hypothetical protein
MPPYNQYPYCNTGIFHQSQPSLHLFPNLFQRATRRTRPPHFIITLVRQLNLSIAVTCIANFKKSYNVVCNLTHCLSDSPTVRNRLPRPSVKLLEMFLAHSVTEQRNPLQRLNALLVVIVDENLYFR